MGEKREVVRISVDVPRDVHRSLRILAALEDTSLAELIRKLIDKELETNPKSNAS